MRYRISGHETFALRFAWLPKAVKGVTKHPRLFQTEDDAMVTLGVGKNMVRAIRFWAECAGVVAAAEKGEHQVTRLGQAILGPDGLDPYMEDSRTLWLLHWQLATGSPSPLLAWDFLLNRWHRDDLSVGAAMEAARKDVSLELDEVSDSTLEAHFSVFLRTYASTRGRKGESTEDSLDCPLVELRLLGRIDGSGSKDGRYVFRHEEKPEITAGLFAWTINDLMNRHGVDCTVLSFREIAAGHGGPGTVFKIPESDIRERMATIEADTNGYLRQEESVNLHQVRRKKVIPSVEYLKRAYEERA